jgi:hypothetical protein
MSSHRPPPHSAFGARQRRRRGDDLKIIHNVLLPREAACWYSKSLGDASRADAGISTNLESIEAISSRGRQ